MTTLEKKEIKQLTATPDYTEVASSLVRPIVKPMFIYGCLHKASKANFQKEQVIEIDAVGYYRFNNLSVHGCGLFVTQHDELVYSDNIGTKKDSILSHKIRTYNSDITIANDQYQLTTEKNVLHINEPVIILSQRGFHIYGHWIIDMLPRLALCKNDHKELKIVVTKDIPNYAYKLLELFGYRKSDIIVHNYDKEILRCKVAIIPTASRSGNDLSHLHPYVGKIYDELLHKFDFKKESKFEFLYLSRKKEKNQMRRLLNRIELDKSIQKFPLLEIFPEKLSFPEQINIYRNAKVMVGEYGSALHNSLFANSDLKVVSLSGNHILSFIQHRVCEAKNQRIGYIFGESIYKKDNRTMADFIIEPQTLEKGLRTVFKNEI